jgi:hypothetical protein
MKIEMTVHNVLTQPREVLVMYQGQQVRATLLEQEVQLTTNEEQHGSLTLRFMPGTEALEAQKLFKQGASVTATFTPNLP